MMGEIIIWVIGGVGLLLFFLCGYAARINEREIRESRKKLNNSKPWDITDVWEKQQQGAEEANARAAIGMFIGGFMMLLPIMNLLYRWGLFG